MANVGNSANNGSMCGTYGPDALSQSVSGFREQSSLDWMAVGN